MYPSDTSDFEDEDDTCEQESKVEFSCAVPVVRRHQRDPQNSLHSVSEILLSWPSRQFNVAKRLMPPLLPRFRAEEVWWERKSKIRSL